MLVASNEALWSPSLYHSYHGLFRIVAVVLVVVLHLPLSLHDLHFQQVARGASLGWVLR